LPNDSAVFLLVGVGIVMALVAWFTRDRDDVEARLQDEWGKPLDTWRDIEAIGEYHRWKAEDGSPVVFLDDRTWSDLHLDLVFSEVDRTRSSIGKQLLYHRLRSTPTGEDLARFEHLVQYFERQEEVRVSAQLLLSQLSHSAGYRLWALCRKDGVRTHWWYGLFPVLALAVVGFAVAVPFWPRAILVLLGIAAINVGLRISLAYRVFHLLGPFKEVGALLKCANGVLPNAEVSAILGAGQIQVDLKAVSSLKTTARWASRNSAMENEIAGSAYEYVNMLFMIDANAVLFATRTLRQSGPSLLRIIEALGEIDAAISVASLRAGERDWCLPEFTTPGSPTVLDEVWHPLVEEAVANSVVMTAGRGLIITGSNMSGKSTFLRTVGVTVVLAQTLNTCPAAAYSGPTMNVRSAIGRSDDLTAGKSYYLVEVEAVLELLKVSEKCEPHLFLFDELFRGTNTVERLSAGEAVLRALPLDAQGEGCHVVIAATHDGELVQMLEGMYDPYSFEETIVPDGLTFGYKLKTGPARTRSAIALLEICGAPSEIVEQARLRAIQLDAERSDRLPKV
jgi:MutS domain V